MADHNAGSATAPRVVTGVLVVAVLALFSSLNSYQVSAQLTKQFPDPYGVAAAQQRFAAVLPKLPATGPVGYLSDLKLQEQAGTTAFLATQYAFAPRVLLPVDEKTAPPFAVGNFSQAGNFAVIGGRFGYGLVEDLGGGVVLYRNLRESQTQSGSPIPTATHDAPATGSSGAKQVIDGAKQ